MKILGISGSTRSAEASGTAKLVNTVLEATQCDYDYVFLAGKKISPCIACLGCVKDNVCKVKDDMTALRDKFIEADAFVIGAPNFFSDINAQTHALLERLYQFRHQEGDSLWGKLAVTVGVGGSSGAVCCDRIETFMDYSFIETVAKVSGQGAACCYTCGYGETCRVGAVHMMHGENYTIKDDDVPNVAKQPDVIKAARAAGELLAGRLNNGHDRKAVTMKMQQRLMEKFQQST